jgi:hypothetical protein
VHLHHWEVDIPPNTDQYITTQRPQGVSDNQLILWHQEGEDPVAADRIELNSAPPNDWTGPGKVLQNNPSFSSYNGFDHSSRFEALLPGTDELCGFDGGAEQQFVAGDPKANCGASGGYLCNGNYGEQASGVPNPTGKCKGPGLCLDGPDGDFCRYLYDKSYAINWDENTKKRSLSHMFVQNNQYVQFWCGSFGEGDPGIAVMTYGAKCSGNTEVDLRITTCIENGPPIPLVEPQPPSNFP